MDTVRVQIDPFGVGLHGGIRAEDADELVRKTTELADRGMDTLGKAGVIR
jgi:hypothetical protein